MRKTKYFAIGIKFQETGSPHVNSFIWVFNVPIIQNETAYIEFIEKTKNAHLSDHLKDPMLFELRVSKFILILERVGNTKKKKKNRFSYD